MGALLWLLTAAGTAVGVAVLAPLQASDTPGSVVFLPIVGPEARQVAEVQFSVARGYHSSSFRLALTSPTPGSTIWYTTD